MPRLPFLDSATVPIIGLAGHARSGKNTVADIIRDIAEVPVFQDAFANRLKVSAARSLGFEFETLEEYLDWADGFKEECSITIEVLDINEEPYMEAVKKISGREFLQFYGTEAHREVFNTDFWVDQLADHLNPDFLTIITDVRFENEAQLIKRLGGIVIRVSRDQVEKLPGEHASESPIDESLVDYEIDNSGTMDDLISKVNWILRKEGAWRESHSY